MLGWEIEDEKIACFGLKLWEHIFNTAFRTDNKQQPYLLIKTIPICDGSNHKP
jgi:hypothetical protein